MIDQIKTTFKKYAVFSGRATRTEYWYFVLFCVVANIVLSIVGFAISRDFGELLKTVFTLVVILPILGVSVRRLHDTNHSGWWLLINLIPLVGFIVMLVFALTDSGPDNQYGPNPKAVIQA